MNLPDFLTEWPYGEIVLTGHRIGLFHVIEDHNAGYSPERLHEEYPTLSVELIQKVIGFYLENWAEVDAYVARCEAELARLEATTPRVLNWEEMRRKMEAQGWPKKP